MQMLSALVRHFSGNSLHVVSRAILTLTPTFSKNLRRMIAFIFCLKQFMKGLSLFLCSKISILQILMTRDYSNALLHLVHYFVQMYDINQVSANDSVTAKSNDIDLFLLFLVLLH